VKPAPEAISTATIGARTEKKPFTAHAQGMRFAFVAARWRMPPGKSIPMRRPAGARTADTAATLTGSGAPKRTPGRSPPRVA